jgi:putative effector of murein hydrolase LrgA (UPF0299 family)
MKNVKKYIIIVLFFIPSILTIINIWSVNNSKIRSIVALLFYSVLFVCTISYKNKD